MNLFRAFFSSTSLVFASVAIGAPTMVVVGDAGNVADPNPLGIGNGSVAYKYSIGKYEVTNSEYVEFLNATAVTDSYALYNASMGSDGVNGGVIRSGTSGGYTYSTKAGMENKSVNYVSFWDAVRYTNWLTNGATAGAATETGVYVLTSGGISGNTVVRDSSAWNAGGYAVTSINEWYKAAFYKGGTSDAGYWIYATQSDSIPTSTSTPNSSPNQVNYGGTPSLTPVGSFTGSGSAYGTFDQNGGVYEWNDDIYGPPGQRTARGGSIKYSNEWSLAASSLVTMDPTTENDTTGFRISRITAVPEAEYGVLTTVALAAVVFTRRRKARRAE
jgi:sulfatase modifying factor 1